MNPGIQHQLRAVPVSQMVPVGRLPCLLPVKLHGRILPFRLNIGRVAERPQVLRPGLPFFQHSGRLPVQPPQCLPDLIRGIAHIRDKFQLIPTEIHIQFHILLERVGRLSQPAASVYTKTFFFQPHSCYQNIFIQSFHIFTPTPNMETILSRQKSHRKEIQSDLIGIFMKDL